MIFYRLIDTSSNQFAQAGRRGTWSAGLGICLECTSSRQERIPPLIIEWDAGSDKIGDFTWATFSSEIIVKQHVRELLEKEYDNLMFFPVEMIQSHSMQQPVRPTKKTIPRVWLPYEGESLWELQATTICRLNLELSGISIQKICSTCGRIFYNNLNNKDGHLIIESSTWNSKDIFAIHEYGNSRIFCTERAKYFLESQGFTNLGFQLQGEIDI